MSPRRQRLTDVVPQGLFSGALWHTVTLSVLVGGSVGIAIGLLSNSLTVGLSVGVGVCLVLALGPTYVLRREVIRKARDDFSFAPSPRVQRTGVRWRARVLHLQRRQLVWRAPGTLSVLATTIEFVPRRGLSAPGMRVFPWGLLIQEVRSIDVVTPSAVIDVPSPHLRIVSLDGDEEFFTLRDCPESVAAESLCELLGFPSADCST